MLAITPESAQGNAPAETKSLSPQFDIEPGARGHPRIDEEPPIASDILLNTEVAEPPSEPPGIVCPQCHNVFVPRTGTGGHPQKFCSAKCREDARQDRRAGVPLPDQCAALSPLSEDQALVWLGSRWWRNSIPDTPTLAKLWGWTEDRAAAFYEAHRHEAATSEEVFPSEAAPPLDEYTEAVRALSEDELKDILEAQHGRRPVYVVTTADRKAPASEASAIDNIIPWQAEMKISGLVSGGIELTQGGQYSGLDDDDADRIDIGPRHVVEVARRMLHAAGFEGVEILCGRHREEVQDGQTSDQFDFTPPPPPKVIAATTVLPPKAPEPEPEPNIWDDAEAVFCEQQNTTAIYRNPYGGLVIRQDAQYDDATVIISQPFIESFVKRVAKVAAEVVP